MPNDKQTGTIHGSPIVETRSGQYTGDRQHVTADGRVWSELRGGVPNTVPTGATVATIQWGR